MKRTTAIALLASILFLVSRVETRAAVSTSGELEVMQAQATLQYHSKQYPQCLTTLKKILEQDAKNIAAMEMMALTLKAQNSDEEAATYYSKLLEIAPKEKKPAYNFELATLRYQQKKTDEARKHFLLSAKGKFNPGMSNFFLGVIDFNAKAWKQARNHLAASLTYSDADSMKTVTRYYLASAYAQLGKSDAAVHNYHEAHSSAYAAAKTGGPAAALSTDIRRNALKELKALSKSQAFATFSLSGQWDTNVQANPTELSNPIPPSDQASAKTVFNAAFGYSTAPTARVQLTPSYRFYTNYNFNEPTKDYNFASHTPGVYAIYRPFARLSGGLKFEGTFSQKNTFVTNQSRSDLNYKPFSLTGDIGPLVRYELTPRINLALEATWRPKKFYMDPSTGSTRRSGTGYFSRLTGDFISDYLWLAPMAFVTFERDQTAGTDYRFYSIGGGISNPVSVTDQITLTPSIDLTAFDYYDTRDPSRSDTMLNLRLGASYAFMAHWAATFDFAYTNNDSSLTGTYKYNRWLYSAGFSYSL